MTSSGNLETLADPQLMEVARVLHETLPTQMSIAFDRELHKPKLPILQREAKLPLGMTEAPTVEAQHAEFAAIRAGVAAATLEGNKLRNERMRQSQVAFNIAAVMVIFGTGILLLGICGAIFGFVHTTVATISGVAGVVVDVLAAIPYRLKREADLTLKRYEDLNVSLASVDTSLQLAQRMTDSKERDAVLRALIQNVSQLSDPPSKAKRPTSPMLAGGNDRDRHGEHLKRARKHQTPPL